MNYNHRLAKILAASIITTALVYLFDILTFRFTIGVQQSLGYRGGLIVSLALSLVFAIIASVPGMALLKQVRVPQWLALSLLGVFEGYWVSYIVVAVVMPLVGRWAWLPMMLVSFLLGYVLADFLLNVWQATPKHKTTLAVALAVVTMLVANLMPMIGL